MAQRYSHYYRELVDEVSALAEARLGRGLGPEETYAIHNAGSTVMLDTVRLRLMTATSTGAIEGELGRLAMLGEDKLRQTRMQLAVQLVNLLGRDLTEGERGMIGGLPSVHAALNLAEEIIETQPERREDQLRRLLARK